MNTTPYWSHTAAAPKFQALKHGLEVDVAVVGGGITGVTAAFLLQQAGASVALLERERFASVDTGHTTAHLTYVTDTRLAELVKYFGRDHARAVWDAGAAALGCIHELVEKHAIACEFAWVPGFLHAPVIDGSKDEPERL